MNKVYAVDISNGVDISKGSLFGEIVHCTTVAFERNKHLQNTIIDGLIEALKDFEVNDYLLPVGNPILISIAIHEILMKNGEIKILTWDKRNESYAPRRLTVSDKKYTIHELSA